jgi:hypothetical protein
MNLLTHRKRILLLVSELIFSVATFAQDPPTLAVYVSSTEIPTLNKAMATGLITALANSGRYRAADNYKDFFDRATEEQKNGPASINTEQIKRLGQRFGVQYVCIAEIITAFGEKQISAQVVSVKTGEVVARGIMDSPLSSRSEVADVSKQIVSMMINNSQPQTPQPTAKIYTGKVSITILAPEATGLGENQSHLPILVQDEFIQAFSGFFDIRDRESVDAAWVELTSAAYDDTLQAVRNIGRLTNTSHYMVGKITKVGTDYHLRMSIVRIADNMTTASYSNAFNYWQINNRTGIRQAVLELLQKMGVTLTAEAQKKLVGAAEESYINSRNAYAQGVTAQRQGSEVAALSYYLQAAAFDPSLREAVNRSSILSANIKSGSIGQDARNDIAWRKQWMERLTETERFFDKFTQTESMPYTLFYMLDIKQNSINYQNETVKLQMMAVYLRANTIWALSIERALQEVYDGLNATGRARDWGLANWPQQRVTNLSPFVKRNDFSIGFELLNDRGKTIYKGKLTAYGSWQMNSSSWNNTRPKIIVATSPTIRSNGGYSAYLAEDINVNDVTDNMTLRVTSVNNVDAETAAINGVLQIKAISKEEFMKNCKFQFENGELRGYAKPPYFSENRYMGSLEIPNVLWDEPVISIGQNAFSNIPTLSITIGANIHTYKESFKNNFSYYYENNGRKAGTYIFDVGENRWTYGRSLHSSNANNAVDNYYAEKMTNSRMAEEKRKNNGIIFNVVAGILIAIGMIIVLATKGD